MDLKNYFGKTRGLGILATADKDGKVNAAVYARPHIMDDGTAAFIMRDRLTHHNMQTNPYATYMFVADGSGYKGKRLYLKKIREEQDTPLVDKLRRRTYDTASESAKEPKFLVFFEIERELPLLSKHAPSPASKG
jgi:predicted pyridoxine 5'-phosphate oxidase superfamily flavin-nucleotide-binding protein